MPEPSELAKGLYPEPKEEPEVKEAEAPEAEKPEAEKPKEAPKEPEAPAPEKKEPEAPAPVELKITAPEGVKLDEAKLTAASALMREAGITDTAKAQALADFYFRDVTELAKAAASENRKSWDALQAQWKQELASDPDLGGDKAVEAQKLIGRAIDEYGSKEVREAFETTGSGNNPHIARMIHKMAKALSEGGIVAGGRPRQAPKSLGESLYGPEKGTA